ncbi:hypothetical protein B7463_g8818, partial [Scytalidium lignicola]
MLRVNIRGNDTSTLLCLTMSTRHQVSQALLLLSLLTGANSQGPIHANATTTAAVGTVTLAAGSSIVPTFSGDPSNLSSWCSSLYTSYLEASGTPTTFTSLDTFTGESSSIEIDTNTIKTTVVATSYTPPPQCFTGCDIDAQVVLLHYWPTPKPGANATLPATPTITPPPVVSAVVDGKTFVSPSNYIVFSTISAFACPLDDSPCSTIGNVVFNTTLAFGQNELFSINCNHASAPIDYRDFNTPIPWSIVSQQPGCTTLGFSSKHPGSEPDPGFTLNPSILMPTELRTAINPLWASCTFAAGAFDPPSALSPVQQLTSSALPTTIISV